MSLIEANYNISLEIDFLLVVVINKRDIKNCTDYWGINRTGHTIKLWKT